MTAASSDHIQTALQLVLKAARLFPDRIALELHDAKYTYHELTEAASSVAQELDSLDDTCPYVAVMADKSFSCYSGILGILMAGKAYLPINPRFPVARNHYMLEKSRARTIIAGDTSDEELDNILENSATGMYVIFPEGKTSQVTSQVTCEVTRLQDPAYLLFTSGTTGKPKGVTVSNGNLAAYLGFMMNAYDFSKEDRFTQIFDLTFDLSVHDVFLAWSCGACLCVPEDNSSFAMSRFIREKKPSVWFSVPSVVNLMDRMRILKPGTFNSVRLSFFCGEALQLQTAQAWKMAADKSRLVNLYGPTEATIAISGYELLADKGNWKSESGIVSIGKVFERNSFRIEKGNQDDESGVLCLAGNQVINGYFENEEADRQAFFIDPGTKLKYYRTGDLVKTDKDNDLFFLGRKDAEVKISGYRVNTLEIGNILEGYETVRQAVVIYDKAENIMGTLLAFIISKENVAGEKELDQWCHEHLPWYMVPGKFIFVNEMPLNVNGKIDKSALLRNYRDGK